MITCSPTNLYQYLVVGSGLDWPEGDFPTCKISANSAEEASGTPSKAFEWTKSYLNTCHYDAQFTARWRAVTGGWDDKIVVDIGCGSGDLYALMGGSPELLIGVDANRAALEKAQKIGYTPLLANAHHIPLTSEFADIVALNSMLHHCTNQEKALAEAARLVRPGGVLVTDYDPQLSAWNYKGLGRLFYKMQAPHKPAEGMTPEFYAQVLKPMGFTVKVYPHNHTVGAEVLQGDSGRSTGLHRLAQKLSGINPDSKEAALSLMCVATRDA